MYLASKVFILNVDYLVLRGKISYNCSEVKYNE